MTTEPDTPDTGERAVTGRPAVFIDGNWRHGAARAIYELHLSDAIDRAELKRLCAALRSGLTPVQRRRAAMDLLSDPDTSVVTRFEVIDETGRAYTRREVTVELQLQDDDRTLKAFIAERESEQ
jgi:hypothetical protein